jgi:hypothetical protein
MESIKQINGNYLPQPDRVLLKISTLEDHEYAFFLTRRIVCVLTELFQRETAHAAHPHDIKFSLHDISNLKEDLRAKKIDFKAPYNGAKIQPLGKAPHLISAVKLTQHKKGLIILRLSLRDQPAVRFNVNVKVMRIMLQFFNKIQSIAHWNIDIEEDEGVFLDEHLGASVNKFTLH